MDRKEQNPHTFPLREHIKLLLLVPLLHVAHGLLHPRRFIGHGPHRIDPYFAQSTLVILRFVLTSRACELWWRSMVLMRAPMGENLHNMVGIFATLWVMIDANNGLWPILDCLSRSVGVSVEPQEANDSSSVSCVGKRI